MGTNDSYSNDIMDHDLNQIENDMNENNMINGEIISDEIIDYDSDTEDTDLENVVAEETTSVHINKFAMVDIVNEGVKEMDKNNYNECRLKRKLRRERNDDYLLK